MNLIFVISLLFQCLTNEQKQRFYLQLDEQLGIIVQPAQSASFTSLPSLYLFLYSLHRVRRERSWVLSTASVFFSILLQFKLAKNSSCLSHSNLDSLSELLLQKYTGHLIQLIFLNCPEQHFSFQFSIA